MAVVCGGVVVAVGEVDGASKAPLGREVAAYWKEERGPQYLPSFAFFAPRSSGGGVRCRGSACISDVGCDWQNSVVRHV